MVPRTLIRMCLLAPALGCGFEESATSAAASLSTSGASTTGATGSTNTTTTTTMSTGPERPTTSTTTGEPTPTTEALTTGTPPAPSTGPDPSTSSSTTSSETGTSGTSAPAPSCDDGALNQDETDVDCGGSCEPCLEGQACAAPGDCATEWCEAEICVIPECLSDDDCADLASPCTAAACTPETKTCAISPAHEGEDCDDGDLCTQVDTCAAGACVGGSPVDCSELDTFCGIGTCDPESGTCALTGKEGMEGEACDDGFVCTPNDSCQPSGDCGAGGPGYVLFEDFSGAAEGWTLGPTWEIGPAMASPPVGIGVDPGMDHSPGDDNRLAGVLIGGSVEEDQAKTCLTSPPVDTTAAPTTWVTYWRHLHTDYFPFAVNEVEVFDGIEWVGVELGYNNPGVDDPDWQEESIDLSLFSNEALQVRICYTRSGALPFAGWSVDDVTIGAYACTPE